MSINVMCFHNCQSIVISLLFYGLKNGGKEGKRLPEATHSIAE